MDEQEIYQRLKILADTIPDLAVGRTGLLPIEAYAWLGQLTTLVEEMGITSHQVSLHMAPGRMVSDVNGIRRGAVADVHAALFHALAEAAARAPAPNGAFIPVGNSFDAHTVLGEIMRSASAGILLVDPYLTEFVLTDVALLAPEGIAIRLLGDAAHLAPGTKPALTAWGAQYGDVRPVEAHMTGKRALHDRAILVDSDKVWLVSQSFKDLAKRSPATVQEAGAEIAALKREAYETLWHQAAPL